MSEAKALQRGIEFLIKSVQDFPVRPAAKAKPAVKNTIPGEAGEAFRQKALNYIGREGGDGTLKGFGTTEYNGQTFRARRNPPKADGSPAV